MSRDLNPEEEAEIRENAKQWAKKALHFNEQETADICAFIDEIPIKDAGRPYCQSCESMLCGACGHCHSYDTNWEVNGVFCPLHEEYNGWNCAAYFQAINSLWEARREAGEDI